MGYDITSAVPDETYLAAGGQTIFTVPYTFIDVSHLVVTVNDVLKTIVLDYNVVGAGQTGGGTVTFTAGLNAGDVVRITRYTPRGRVSAYVPGGGLSAEALETDLDKLTAMIQELEQTIALQQETLDIYAQSILVTDAGEQILIE